MSVPLEQASAPVRRILHVDVDAMFVQCAIIADPERLADEPLILVGGSPEGRGVVTSASYGCRAYGVRSAMPMATALRLCPKAIVVRTPGEMIRQKNRELRELLPDWSPIATMASVDEGYLDMTGTEMLYGHEPLEATARRIQADVKERTGLDVSIGGGSNRLVAKLATSFAKPAGVYVVPPGEEESFIGGLELKDLIGVGPSLLSALERKGITTMAALQALGIETMASWWGPERARWLWRRCRGIDSSPVTPHEGVKSVSSETTFARDLSDFLDLEQELLGQVVDAAASLRRKGLYARTLTVKVRDHEFRDRSRSRTLDEPVRTDHVIFRIARQLLADLWRRDDSPVRLIGVALTSLSESDADPQQVIHEVAPPIEGERDRRLAEAVDRIRDRHGRIIGPGTVTRSIRRTPRGPTP